LAGKADLSPFTSSTEYRLVKTHLSLKQKKGVEEQETIRFVKRKSEDSATALAPLGKVKHVVMLPSTPSDKSELRFGAKINLPTLCEIN